MKLKYILPLFIALCAGFISSCSKDDDPTFLSEVRVSSSIVALSAEGGQQTFTVDAVDDWSIEVEPAVAEWFTISPLSGKAGKTEVTVSAPATKSSLAAVVNLVCRNRTQKIILQQIAEKVEIPISPISAVIANPTGTYRVKGVCVSNPDNEYGNWNIQDETGTVYVYGTCDRKGNKGKGTFPISGANGWGFTVGDVITVEGPATLYGSTVELVDVTVISVQKSLIKIEEGETAAFDANGGEYVVRLSYSGDYPSITVAEDAKSWIGISSMVQTDSTLNVTFRVAPNDAEQARTGNIEFTSKSGSSSSTLTSTVSQMGLSGTLTNPFSVADAIAYCQSLTGATANDFYVKGIVSKIEVDKNGVSQEFGSYGNATFWISEDGMFHDDLSLDFEGYRVLYFNNEKWTEGHANISVGDEVLICGKLTLYKGTAETSGNAAYIYSINGVKDDANGVGSAAYPFNVAGAIASIDAKCLNIVYVKGKVSEFANNGQFGATYGNGTFWISDDGVRHNDSMLDFEAYRVLWLGNRKWAEGDAELAVGDEVVLCGLITKYNSTYETSSGKAYVYSVNGKTE